MGDIQEKMRLRGLRACSLGNSWGLCLAGVSSAKASGQSSASDQRVLCEAHWGRERAAGRGTEHRHMHASWGRESHGGRCSEPREGSSGAGTQDVCADTNSHSDTEKPQEGDSNSVTNSYSLNLVLKIDILISNCLS